MTEPTATSRPEIQVSIEPAAAPGDVAAVQAGLLAFNRAVIGDPGEVPVHVFLREADGTIVGGLLGHIRWRWLYVSKLWVADALRGRGFGSALLEAAESEARAHRCLGVHLDTFEYQARPFYERHGYTLFGTLENYPPGYSQYHLAKHFDEEPRGAAP